MPPPRSTANRLLLRDALLADRRRVDVLIADDRIEAVTEVGVTPIHDVANGHPPTELVDLDGRLLLPAMAEPHAHLDKALTAEIAPNQTGDLVGAIDAWIEAAAAGRFHHVDIVERAAVAIELLVLNGVTTIRTHVNVGADVGTMHVRAVKEARERFAGIADVEVVALTASPMSGADGAGNRSALAAALEEGVDLVGGCPHLDPDPGAVIDGALRAATEAGLPVDLHMDETLDAEAMSLRELARRVLATGFAHPVTASHCVSLGVQPVETQRVVAREVAEARISVVTLPQTNLFLQGRDHPVATPRGLTAVAALRDAGVTVAAGGDNVQDPFNLVGRSDPLETAALLVMAAHLLPDDAYRLVSDEARRVLGREHVAVSPGSPADLVALRAPSTRAAIADAPHDRIVFHRGRIVAVSTEQRQLVR